MSGIIGNSFVFELSVERNRCRFMASQLKGPGFESQLGWLRGTNKTAVHDGERTGSKSLVNISHRAVEPGVPPPVTWSTQLVMPAQPAPGECESFVNFSLKKLANVNLRNIHQ